MSTVDILSSEDVDAILALDLGEEHEDEDGGVWMRLPDFQPDDGTEDEDEDAAEWKYSPHGSEDYDRDCEWFTAADIEELRTDDDSFGEDDWSPGDDGFGGFEDEESSGTRLSYEQRAERRQMGLSNF